MAKQTVNIGTTANDRTGDNLRTAFNKINENFSELYTALGLDEAPLNLGAFEFTGSTITTTDSSGIVIDQSTTVTSDLTVGGDILPQTANGGDLGSSERPWKSLYVSDNTIFIGARAIAIDDSGNLIVDGAAVSADWNAITGKPTLAPVATSGDYNDLSNKPTISTVPTDLSQLNNDTNFIVLQDAIDYGFLTAADIADGVTVNSTGDLKGSVFADDSTLLVDATNGIIPWSVISGAATVATSGNYNDLTNKPTIPTLGNFTLSANNITASSGAAPILLKIFGGDSADPPALISKEWSFGTDGSLTIPSNGRITLGDDGFYITTTDISIYGLSVAYTSELQSAYASSLTGGTIATPATLSINGDVDFTNANVSGLNVVSQGLTYIDPGEGLSTQVGLDADIFDFGTGNTVDLQGNSVLFNGATISDFAPGSIYALNGQYLYVASASASATTTNVAFTYDTNISNVRQTFYGKTEFGNNGQAPIVDFTGATVTGLSFVNRSTLLVDLPLNSSGQITYIDWPAWQGDQAFDSSNSYIWTAQHSGIYRIDVTISFTALYNDFFEVWLAKDISTTPAVHTLLYQANQNGGTDLSTFSVSTTTFINAGEEYKLAVVHSASGSLSLSSQGSSIGIQELRRA